jgi:hypothetical protein
MCAIKFKVMVLNCVVIGLSHSQKLLGSWSKGVLFTAYSMDEEVGDFVGSTHCEKSESGLEVFEVSDQLDCI